MRELTTVLASPEMVLAELERASSSDARNDDRAAAQQLLAPLRGYEVEERLRRRLRPPARGGGAVWERYSEMAPSGAF